MVLVLFGLPVLIRAQKAQHPSEVPAAGSWLILPEGSSGGIITAQTTEAELIRLYGKQNVVPQDVDLGEGETEPGSALFPSDPIRRVEILWKDAGGKRLPKRVQTSGEKTLWKTVHGISLGSSLKRLEQLNRKPFFLAGFGWDYSGTVLSWDQGALEQELDHVGRVILRLQPANDQSLRQDDRAVLGDRQFSSGHPAMQILNPTIYQIIWLFP